MNVMKKAWEIAKDGAAKFGGKVKEYFAQALKMAWAEAKGATKKTAQLAAIEAKAHEMYNEYVSALANQSVVTGVAKNGTDVEISYTEKGRTKKVFVSFEMSDFDVFAKVVRNNHKQYVGLGSAFVQ